MQSLGHCLLAEAAAGVGAIVGEYREVNRRLLQPGELQPGIDRLLLASIALKRLLIGICKARHDRRALVGRDHMHEAPGLAETDRRRMACDLEQRVDAFRRDRVGLEAPHVTPPQDEGAEAVAKRLVENRIHVSPCR